MKKCFYILSLLASFQLASSQCMLIDVPLKTRVDKSIWIVEGRVVESHSFWNDAHNSIYTSHLVEVSKVFKGNADLRTVEIITPGGRVGNRGQRNEPSLQVRAGDSGIFFGFNSPYLNQIPQNLSKTETPFGYGEPLNFLRYDDESNVARDELNTYASIETAIETVAQKVGQPYISVRNLGLNLRKQTVQHTSVVPVITSFSPTTINAGAGEILTINGSGFGSTRGSSVVKFHNPNVNDTSTNFIADATSWEYGDAGSGLPESGGSWSDTQIKIRVPRVAGTGTVRVSVGGSDATSTQTLTIPYALTDALGVGDDYRFNLSLMDNNAQGGYTFQYNTNTVGNGINFNQSTYYLPFESAMLSWKLSTSDPNAPGINFKAGSGIDAPCNIYDGNSVVKFDNDTCPLSGAALGETKIAWIEWDYPPVYNYVDEIDMTFRRPSTMPAGFSWNFTGSPPTALQYDFQSVALHELGHAGLMNHVITSGAVMFWSIPNGTSRRTLAAIDKTAGIASMYKCDQPFWVSQNENCMLNSISGARGSLPVEFSKFEAKWDGSVIILNWQTKSESNNDGFEVQDRMGNDKKAPFKALGWVKGYGTTQQTQDYSYRIENLLPGKHTFRLKQVDFDRSYKHSAEIEYVIEAENTHAVSDIFPNPFNPEAHFYVSVPKAQKVNVEVFNLTGQQVASLYNGDLGANDIREFRFDASGLPTGMYVIRIQGETFKEMLRATFMK